MTDTESIIKTATVDLLLVDGHFGHTLSDVAEKSKISRTVIHYYFRSKENLSKIIKTEIVSNILLPKYDILYGDDEIYSKICHFISYAEKIAEKYPFLEVYVLSQFKFNDNLENYFKSRSKEIALFLGEIQNLINEKKTNYDNPFAFLIDLISLTSYSQMYLNFFLENKNFLPGIPITQNKNFKENIVRMLFCK